VHSLEWNERAQAFAPHRLERATGVAHAVFCETATNRIGDPAGQPLQARISALRAIAANKIGAARNFRKKSWNVGRIILQIAVDKNCSRSARSAKTSIDRGALAGIFFETNHSNIRCGFDSLGRAINGTIIDKNDLMIERL
jgi:hypothetical protein